LDLLGRVIMTRKKGISTSLIRANVEELNTLPISEHYELTFFNHDDLGRVMDFLEQRKATFGVHAPFIYRYISKHPYPTSDDMLLRRDTYQINLQCAVLAHGINAEYMVIHFPNAVQKDKWLNNRKILEDAINGISMALQHIPVRIENVYMNDVFHTAEDYLWILKESGTHMCIDIGHLLIDSEIYNLDPIEFISKCLPRLAEIHIYYADLETYSKCHHAPWGDSREFRKILDFIHEISKTLPLDLIIEPSDDCSAGLEKLIDYWEGV